MPDSYVSAMPGRESRAPHWREAFGHAKKFVMFIPLTCFTVVGAATEKRKTKAVFVFLCFLFVVFSSLRSCCCFFFRFSEKQKPRTTTHRRQNKTPQRRSSVSFALCPRFFLRLVSATVLASFAAKRCLALDHGCFQMIAVPVALWDEITVDLSEPSSTWEHLSSCKHVAFVFFVAFLFFGVLLASFACSRFGGCRLPSDSVWA